MAAMGLNGGGCLGGHHATRALVMQASPCCHAPTVATAAGCATTRTRRKALDSSWHRVLLLPDNQLRAQTRCQVASSPPAAPSALPDPERQPQRRWYAHVKWPPPGLRHLSPTMGPESSQDAPWTPGTKAGDAAVLSSASSCNTWKEVAALYDALLHQQPRDSTAGYIRPSAHRQQPGNNNNAAAQQQFYVQPRHAVILLARLACLYPHLRVRHSAVMQGVAAAAYPPSTPPTINRLATGTQQVDVHSQDSSSNADGALEEHEFSAWGVGGVLAPSGQPSEEDAATVTATDIRYAEATDLPELSLRSQIQGGTSCGGSSVRQDADPVDRDLAFHVHIQRVQQSVEQLADELSHAVVRHPAGLKRLQPSEMCEMLSSLARLGYSRTALAAVVCSHVAESGGLLQLRANPSTLAHTAWAVAKLGIDPGPAWIGRFLQASTNTLEEFSAHDCAAVMWALGKWRFRPAPQWLQALYAQLRHVSSDLDPQGVTNVAWACAMLKVEPPRDVVELMMVETQVVMEQMTAAGLGTVCWSLAMMHQQPPAFWVQAVLSELQHKLTRVPQSARGLPFANTIWALSCWQSVKPDSNWFRVFCRHCAKSIPVMSSRSIAVVLQGLADLGYTPQRSWVCFAFEEFHKRSSDACPSSLVAVLWAVSRLLRHPGALSPDGTPAPGWYTSQSWSPGRDWQLRYAHMVQDVADLCLGHLQHLTPGELMDLLVSLADLKHHPGTPWLTKHAAFCNACIMEFSDYQMRLMAKALTTMKNLKTSLGEPQHRKGQVV